MKKLTMFLVFLGLLFGTSAFAESNDDFQKAIPDITKLQSVSKVAHPESVINRVMKKTVVMMLDDKAFCSGVIAKDAKGTASVFTAGHCCEVYERYDNVRPSVITYDNRRIFVKNPEISRLTDACKMEIDSKRKVTTSIKIGPLGTQRNLFGVSAYVNYSPSQRVPRLFVMGKLLETPYLYVVSGEVFPGMSGSPVVDTKGTLVGFMVAHYTNTPYPNAIISVMDFSGFLNTIRILPKFKVMK